MNNSAVNQNLIVSFSKYANLDLEYKHGNLKEPTFRARKVTTEKRARSLLKDFWRETGFYC